MKLGLKFRDVIAKVSEILVDELDNIVSSIIAHWKVEHNQDGTHGKINASSLTLTGNLSTPGTITATGGFYGPGIGMTDIPETAIADGALLARVGSTETITGAWTFSTVPVLSTLTGYLKGTSGAVTAVSTIPETDIADGSILARLAADETVTGAWLFNNSAGIKVGSGTAKGRFATWNSANYLNVSSNLYWTGTQWYLDDTAAPGANFIIDPAVAFTGYVWSLYYATAGTNPRTPTQLVGVDSAGKIYEQARTTGMGIVTNVTYSSGDFTAGGSMTWTVESGDVTTYQWSLVGDTMTVSWNLNNTTVGGTPANDLRIAIPGGKTCQKTVYNPCFYDDNGTLGVGWAVASVSGTYIAIWKSNFGAWTASTDNTDVRGQITFQVA